MLDAKGLTFETKPYCLYAASRPGLAVLVYEKGPKVVVQGKETEDFVLNTLEPEVLGEAELGYEEVHNPEMYQPHIGVDESGKGDFFGPLVIAGAYVDADVARKLREIGVMDSKRIGSDARIARDRRGDAPDRRSCERGRRDRARSVTTSSTRSSAISTSCWPGGTRR